MTHNNILYSNTILPPEEMNEIIGEHKNCTIPDIEEDQIESCLNIIFKSNPNVNFKTIQYSKKSKILLFYTDKELSLKEYWEYYKTLPKPFQHKQLESKTDILNEIKDILNSDINTDNNCISLYDILLLIRSIYSGIRNIKAKYEEIFKNTIKYSSWYNMNFNYTTNELEIGYSRGPKVDYKITFVKSDNDLFIKKTDLQSNAQEFLVRSGNIVSKLYDELKQYEAFYTQKVENLKAINSNFSVDITNNNVTISTNAKIHEYDFSIKATNGNYDNKYEHECNSNNILNVIIGQEDKIFKRIFVKISDCPEWSQPLLTEIRQKQIENEALKKTKEERKKKRLALIKKLCPFIKGGF